MGLKGGKMNKIKIKVFVKDSGNYIKRDIYEKSIDLEELRHFLIMLGWEEEEIELEQNEIIKLLKED